MGLLARGALLVRRGALEQPPGQLTGRSTTWAAPFFYSDGFRGRIRASKGRLECE